MFSRVVAPLTLLIVASLVFAFIETRAINANVGFLVGCGVFAVTLLWNLLIRSTVITLIMAGMSSLVIGGFGWLVGQMDVHGFCSTQSFNGKPKKTELLSGKAGANKFAGR